MDELMFRKSEIERVTKGDTKEVYTIHLVDFQNHWELTGIKNLNTLLKEKILEIPLSYIIFKDEIGVCHFYRYHKMLKKFYEIRLEDVPKYITDRMF